MIRVMGLVAMILLSGCVTVVEYYEDDEGYAWRKDGIEVPRERWRFRSLEERNLHLRCGLSKSAKACAVIRHEEGGPTCTIYTSRPVDYALFEHEKKHCQGWTHPNGLLRGRRS